LKIHFWQFIKISFVLFCVATIGNAFCGNVILPCMNSDPSSLFLIYFSFGAALLFPLHGYKIALHFTSRNHVEKYPKSLPLKKSILGMFLACLSANFAIFFSPQ